MKENGYRQLMTAEYKREHFPDGCFTGLVQKNNSANARVGIYAAFIGIGIFFNPGFIFGGIMFLSQEGVTTPFFVCMAIGVVWLLLSSLILRLGKVRGNRTREDWIALAAENSHCPEHVITEFDQQLRSSDSYILTFGYPVDPHANAKNILTEDFLAAVSNVSVQVFPIRNIIGAGLVYTTDNTGKVIRKVPVIGLFTKETDHYLWELGDLNLAREFLAFLKNKNPNIDIRDEEIMKEKEFFAWEETARS